MTASPCGRGANSSVFAPSRTSQPACPRARAAGLVPPAGNQSSGRLTASGGLSRSERARRSGFMLSTIVAATLRQRCHKCVIIKTSDDQILQQMADPLATKLSLRAQRRRRSCQSPATIAERVIIPGFSTASVPAPSAGFRQPAERSRR